ncbi:unnamed protein product [Rotaria socialis]|uniref:Uncharacterized protein n=1 Tax=Rotaria socialis TaxID=392032 RepID=A0A818LCP2_9BILA|nr:unnamed protein product [Rotaria socialis]CAF4826634.1 unnamed protein product [Rotaria socialis]
MFDYRSRKILSLILVGLILLFAIYVLHNGSIIQNVTRKIRKGIFTTSSTRSYSGRKSLTPTWPYSGPFLNSAPSEAFVTFSNNNPEYLALLTNVLDTVHLFSTRPIIAYGVDVDLDLDTVKYPRLIKRRLSQKDCGPSIYFCKIYAIVESQVDYGIYIEADTLVNWNVDILFDVLHRWPYPLPLAPRHPDDPNNYLNFLTQFKLGLKNRTTPYIHAHILWNYRAYPFLQRAVNLLRQGQFMGANFDETAINILLWQAKSNHTLCKVDPYVSYLSSYELSEQICKTYCHTAYILIHGAKDPTDMANIIVRLKNHTGSPFVQTPKHGFHYLNETQYTCCYPDSHPSSMHPLLCEHRI